MKLPDGYEFGVVHTDEELEELISFNSNIHDEEDGEELRRQIETLPGFSRELNFYIRDIDKGIVVSSLNAIPSMWAYEGVPLRNLELGFVGTLKEYRRKGLVRALYEHFDELLQVGEYDISTIQGIPYYYRQFGYDFVLPMDRTLWMTVDQLPTIEETAQPEYMKIQIRESTPNDLTDIMNLYDEHNTRLRVYIARSRELWEIQEEAKREYHGEFRTFLFEDNNRVIGYLRLAVNLTSKGPHGSTLRVIESSINTYDGVMRALQLIKTEALKHEFYRIGITGPSTNNLSRIALDIGGRIRGGWKYQLRVPNILGLLNKISPVLEKRLVGSMFEGLTKDLTINTFRHCYLLRLSNGKIEKITDIGMQEVDESRGFRAPPNDLVRLIFGVYDIDEISHNNIDFLVGRDLKSLVETLFPKGESCISYYYC